jgi:hypothetical protein
MAGRRLVERDRCDPVKLPLPRLVGVDVVLGLAAAVERRRHVERGRRLGLPIRLDGLDIAVRARQTAEIVRRRGVCAIGLLLGKPDDGVGIVGVVRRVREEGLAQLMAVGMSEPTGDLVLLGLDRFEIGQAEGVHLVRGRVQRGLGADGEPVGFIAARCRAQARLRTGVMLVALRQVVA